MRKRRIITIAFFAMLFIVSCTIAFARNRYFELEENKRNEEVNAILNDNVNTQEEAHNDTTQEMILENDILRYNYYTKY